MVIEEHLVIYKDDMGYASTKYWFMKLSSMSSLSFSFSNFVLSSITLKFVKKGEVREIQVK